MLPCVAGGSAPVRALRTLFRRPFLRPPPPQPGQRPLLHPMRLDGADRADRFFAARMASGAAAVRHFSPRRFGRMERGRARGGAGWRTGARSDRNLRGGSGAAAGAARAAASAERFPDDARPVAPFVLGPWVSPGAATDAQHGIAPPALLACPQIEGYQSQQASVGGTSVSAPNGPPLPRSYYPNRLNRKKKSMKINAI